MTNEDIIKELTLMRKNFDSNSVYGSYCIDFLDAAIEALKKQQEHSQNTSSKQPDLDTLGIKTGETCEDAISRQAAIDVLDVLCQEHRYRIPGKKETYSQYNEAWQDALDRAEGAIFNLPSAQPEIIRCKDCKHIQKWRSKESAKKFGQIYECAINVLNCPKPEDFCSHTERKTDE